MNLVKWFRKNNTKVMAVVVIVIMVGFIGGSSLTYLLRGSGGGNRAVAYYGQKRKITPNNRAVARRELEILQSLGAGRVLQSQDLRGLLLSELLFSQERGSAELVNYARQAIQRNRYRISDKQLSEIYARTVPTDIYWILLREEAQSAGFHVGPDDVGQLLGQVIPQLFNGSTYAQAMQALVSRYGLPETDILATFGRLLAVLQYSEAACSAESVTDAEIKHLASRENEVLTAACVQLKASFFQDVNSTPSEEEMATQFDKYKNDSADEASEANPYGFGYKLPDRVQLEYIALNLTDVASTVSPPTAEEAETYYQENRERLFSEEVPSDPNDPNSPRLQQVKRYADVADTIMERLTREKIVTKAEQILLDARNLADTKLEATRASGQKLTLAEMKEEAGDYEIIAEDLNQKRGVTLYSGRTGLLSAADVQADRYLGRLFLTGYGSNPIRLGQILFSVEELGEHAVTLMFVPTAEMYRSIGPTRDPMVARTPDLSGQTMAIVRIVAVEPAGPPEDLNVEYSTKTLVLGDASEEDADNVHSVRKDVTEDLRTLAAWDTTKTKAQEFIQVASKEGWDEAVSTFNELYGEQAKSDPNDPNVFELQNLAGLQRIPSEQMQVIATQTANSPGATTFLRQLATEQRFVNRLYALIPAQSDSVTKVPLLMEFKPDHSFYCLQNLSVQRIDQQQFQSMKARLLLREDRIEAQSLAAVHFNPRNILKRMKFAPAQGTEPETDDDAEVTQEDQA